MSSDRAGYSECWIAACACDKRFNLPILMPDGEDWLRWRVECDFCGNQTRWVNTEEQAALLWNEIYAKRGRKRSCAQ
jgi:hypothetical protein